MTADGPAGIVAGMATEPGTLAECRESVRRLRPRRCTQAVSMTGRRESRRIKPRLVRHRECRAFAGSNPCPMACYRRVRLTAPDPYQAVLGRYRRH